MGAKNQNVTVVAGESHVITIYQVKKKDGTAKNLTGALVEVFVGQPGKAPILSMLSSTAATLNDDGEIMSGVRIVGPISGFYSIEIGIAKTSITASQKGKYTLEVWVTDDDDRRGQVTSGIFEVDKTIRP